MLSSTEASRTRTSCSPSPSCQLAHVFINLANLVILSRGRNILSEDFKYYSPETGKLDRDSFLRLTKTIDVGFSTFKINPIDFTVSEADWFGNFQVCARCLLTESYAQDAG